MALPTSGQICFSQLQSEFGGSNPICLSEYYRNGSYVPSIKTGSGTYEDPFGVAASPSSYTITRYYNYTQTYTVRYERGPIRITTNITNTAFNANAYYNYWYVWYAVRAYVDNVLWNPFNKTEGYLFAGGGYVTLYGTTNTYNTSVTAVSGVNYVLGGPGWLDIYNTDFTKVATAVSYVDGPVSQGGGTFYSADRSTPSKTPYTTTGFVRSPDITVNRDLAVSDPFDQPYYSAAPYIYNFRTASFYSTGVTTNINTNVPTSGQICLSNLRGAEAA